MKPQVILTAAALLFCSLTTFAGTRTLASDSLKMEEKPAVAVAFPELIWGDADEALTVNELSSFDAPEFTWGDPDAALSFATPFVVEMPEAVWGDAGDFQGISTGTTFVLPAFVWGDAQTELQFD